MAPSTEPTSIIPDALIQSIAERHGFRGGDYQLVWDGGVFNPSLQTHELAIVAADGRQSKLQIDHQAVAPFDPWKVLSKLDETFAKLARRKRSRGSKA
jgi:hypothetical protein